MQDNHNPHRRGDHVQQDGSLAVVELLLRAEFANDLAASDYAPEALAAMNGGEVISTPLDCDEDQFEKGATLTEKISEEHEEATRHRAHAERMAHGRERADALRRARKADRRGAEFTRRRVLARGPSRPSGGQRRRTPPGDCARHGRARRATRSSARSGDSGGDEPGEPPAPARGRGVPRLDL